MLFSFNRTRSSRDEGGLYTVYAELQKITGKLGKAKPNNFLFLAGILESVVIQKNQACPDLSDFKEIKNPIQTLRVHIVHEQSALFQNHFLNKLLARQLPNINVSLFIAEMGQVITILGWYGLHHCLNANTAGASNDALERKLGQMEEF